MLPAVRLQWELWLLWLLQGAGRALLVWNGCYFYSCTGFLSTPTCWFCRCARLAVIEECTAGTIAKILFIVELVHTRFPVRAAVQKRYRYETAY